VVQESSVSKISAQRAVRSAQVICELSVTAPCALRATHCARVLANAEPTSCVVRGMKNSWTGGEARVMVTAEENLALSVHRCQSGAFERLIDHFESSLFNYAHGILQNSFDAQEVVQDALMRAHRALTKQYDEERVTALALRPWLF